VGASFPIEVMEVIVLPAKLGSTSIGVDLPTLLPTPPERENDAEEL
jgi:hypothetical protein